MIRFIETKSPVCPLKPILKKKKNHKIACLMSLTDTVLLFHQVFIYSDYGAGSDPDFFFLPISNPKINILKTRRKLFCQLLRRTKE